MTVLTTTITPESHTHVKLASPEALFSELVEIGQRYGRWNDDLSLRMHKWIERAVSALSEDRSTEIQNISAAARLQIRQLADLLVNSMDGSPLAHPMLDREWTWEEGDLTRYRQMSSLAPHDGKPLEPQKHLFAKAMIEWKKHASSLFPSQQQLELVPVQSGQKEEQLRLFAYMQMAQNGMQVQALRNLKQRVIDVTIACQQQSAALKAETAAEIARAKERVELHHAVVEKKVVTMSQQHAQIVSAQAKELQTHKTASAQRQAELSEAQRSLEEEKDRLTGVQDDLAKAQQRIRWLESELQDAEGSCTLL